MIRLRKLAEVCEINPRLPRDHGLQDSTPVTFVPMAAIDEVTGSIATPHVRPFVEVRRGYTAFRENDVLFAKITPCMENGKAAIAQGLVTGIGFGSTEFHVLRAGPEVLPEWLRYFVRREQFRHDAKRNFTGTAGQQRVPTSFVENSEIPVPPLPEQHRIVDLLSRAEGIVRLCLEAQAKAQAIIPALFLDMFGDPATNPEGHRVANLGSIAKIIGGSSLPAGQPYSDQKGGFMLLKVSDMNLPGNEVLVRKSNEWVPDLKRKYSVVHEESIILPKRGAAIATNKKRLTTRSALLDPNLMGIEPDTSVVRPSFLYQWFCAFDLASITSGTTVPQLNKGDLSPLSVYLPSMAQQQIFEDRRESILDVVAQQTEAHKRAKATFHALLTCAFRGTMIVTTSSVVVNASA